MTFLTKLFRKRPKARQPSAPLTDDERQKAIEYQQVAALVCHDLDLLLDISEHSKDLDSLKRQVKYVHKMKEETIRDAKKRERRFGAACLVYSAAAAGMVHNEIVSD